MTAYLLASALSIVVALALSPGDWLTRSGLLIASAVVLVVAIAVWWRTGRPRPAVRPAGAIGVDRAPRPARLPARRSGSRRRSSMRRVLSIATPPNDYDSLWYHLARPAFWAQGHAVGYVANANDQRLDIFPPGAEITAAWPMVLEGSERFASLFQLVALARDARRARRHRTASRTDRSRGAFRSARLRLAARRRASGRDSAERHRRHVVPRRLGVVPPVSPRGPGRCSERSRWRSRSRRSPRRCSRCRCCS